MGKAPARLEGKFWQTLGSWQNGVDRPWLDACAVAGANAGLRLGLPHDDLGPILAIDLDFAPGREPLRATAVTAAADSLIDDHLVDAVVRSTVPYRALLLVRLPLGADPGRKVQWKLAVPGDAATAADGSRVEPSKIELLALGQQVVIGGTHASGNAITWQAPGIAATGALPDAAIPILPSRLAVVNLIEAVLRALRLEHGVTVASRTIASDGGHATRMVEDLAPPNAAAVVDLLERLPNPATTDRQTWIAVMLAAKGCIDGLEARGELGDDDEDAIRDAACEWAAKWPHAEGVDDELAKWDADWSTRGAALAGWGSLERLASTHILGWRTARAIDEFEEIHDSDESDPVVAGKPAPVPPPERYRGDPDWACMLVRGKQDKDGNPGAIHGILENVVLALRHAPEWAGRLAFDEFSDRVLFVGHPPWVTDSAAAQFRPAAVRDVDLVHMTLWLSQAGIRVKPDTVRDAAMSIADGQRFHPVRNYLAALKPATRPRLGTWLIDYLGAEDTSYNRAVGRAFMISAVARVMRPGCKVDTVLILEGPQGLLKSTAIEVLVSQAWFTDHLPDMHSKDAQIALHGKWIVELAELTDISRADVNVAKRFISTATDNFRRPYGRVTEDVPRQCIFAGTVNPGGIGYLRDETGNRRFWPVTCGVGYEKNQKVDISGLRAARDELWSEAYAAFLSGEQWWLSDGQETEQKTVADLRREEDVWEPRVVGYLAERLETTPDEVLSEAIGKRLSEWTRADSVRVGRILKALGWVKLQRKRDGTSSWIYAAPEGHAVRTTSSDFTEFSGIVT